MAELDVAQKDYEALAARMKRRQDAKKSITKNDETNLKRALNRLNKLKG